MSKSLEIRGSKRQWLGGKIAATFVVLLGQTLRYRVDDPHDVKAMLDPAKPGVWAFWHSGLLAAPLALTRFIGAYPASTLTSASRDGAVIESFLKCFGVKSVRGSSSRRAVASLIALKRALRAGEQVFITSDGPRGPRYQMAAGVVKLAQSSGAPLFSVRFVYSSSWRLKTWDRLHIPKPFSTVTLVIGEPMYVPQKIDGNAFESYRKKVENVLHQGINDFPNPKT